MSEESHARLTPPRRFPALPGLLACLLILTCGMVMGSVATYFVLHEPDRFGPPAPGEMPDKITKQLRKDLALSEEQVAKVHAVFERSEQEMDRIRTKVAPEMDAQFDQVEAEIASLLHPDQLDRWKKKCQEMRARVHSRRPHGRE